MKKPNTNRFAALALSFLAPGAGHVYAGHFVQGMWWFGLTLGSCFVLTAAALFAGAFAPMLILIASGLFPVLFVAQIIAAQIVVGRPRESEHAKVIVYAGMWFAGIAVANMIRLAYLEPFMVPSEAMAPTLVQGDQFFIAKAGPAANWSRGDIVVVTVAVHGRPPVDVVKRVIALAGDTVEVVDGHVKVNDVDLTGADSTESIDGRSWHIVRDDVSPSATAPRVVAKRSLASGEVYLLGDNRDLSEDSRVLGPYLADSVKGRAIVIWLSPHLARIGHAL